MTKYQKYYWILLIFCLLYLFSLQVAAQPLLPIPTKNPDKVVVETYDHERAVWIDPLTLEIKLPDRFLAPRQ